MKKLLLLITGLTFFPLQYIAAQQQSGDLDKKIKEVEKAIVEGKKRSYDLKKRAENLKSDISKAKQGRIIIANTVQNLEKKLSKLEEEIIDLNEAEKEKIITG